MVGVRETVVLFTIDRLVIFFAHKELPRCLHQGIKVEIFQNIHRKRRYIISNILERKMRYYIKLLSIQNCFRFSNSRLYFSLIAFFDILGI